MEDNKYLCPECNSEMVAEYNKPALTLTCPKCGCKIATTKWDDIDVDPNIYKIIVMPNNDESIESIKIISKLTGKNFKESKELLKNGFVIFEGYANFIKEKISLISNTLVKYEITPHFPY